ncbi:MAG: hypothetical protein ACD_2C00037G0010 [uncultured bacterium (gcode 4)]|uniref:STAS domain-containing protein n=1 Tax=uncultured bacterium (gcode 4) TaxID=1234023 RepID=K2FGB2_9BACT|nr:MAG: hypothetical protein ACD_2C00037G0010 [uncultured bacterium (gcode 4)]
MIQVFEYGFRNWFHVFAFIWPIEQRLVENAFRKIEEISKNYKVILDLSKVDYVSSIFIWYMYSLFERSTEAWWYLCFVNVHEDLQDTFSLTWVFDIIPYHKDVQSAFKFILS